MGGCSANCQGTQKIALEDSQNHLIKHLQAITSHEKRKRFESQLGKLDFSNISKTLKKAEESSIISSSTTSNEFQFKAQTYSPLNDRLVFKMCDNRQLRTDYQAKGLEAIQKQEVGVLIMSGRQSSHLPNIKHIGTYDIGLDSAASIFEVLLKRLSNLNELCGRTIIPVYIMTSTENKHQIKDHFQSKNYFGYGKQNVFFFSQSVGPLFNETGQIVLKEEGEILMAAQGNGMMFKEIKDKKLNEHFEQRGIKYLYVCPCDNLMLKVADPEEKDIVGTCFEFNKKIHKREDFGFYGTSQQEQIKIYETVSNETEDAKWVNSGSCFFRVSFISKVVGNSRKMQQLMENCSLKFIDKQIIDLSYSQKMPILRKCISFEFFYHDIFALASRGRIGVMEIDPEEEFAEIKKNNGEFVMQAARFKLRENHRKWIQAAGYELEGTGYIQLSPDLTYFGKGLHQKLLERGYIKKKIQLPAYIF